MQTITLVTTEKKMVDEKYCPFITEVITIGQYQKQLYNLKNVIIIDGFETANKIFPNIAFNEHKITQLVYWFYQESDFPADHTYYIDLRSFIFEVIFPQLVFFQKEIIYKQKQLDKYKNDTPFFLYDKASNICFLYYGSSKIICLINLNHFSFINNKKVEIKDLIDEKYYSIEDLKYHLKRQGLVDKRFLPSNIHEYFKTYSFKTDDENEYYFYLIMFYDCLLMLESVDNKIEFKLESDIISLENLNDIVNPIDNIFYVENYLSAIIIKSLDLNLYPKLNFPIVKDGIKYEYSGSDTATGRIFNINLGNHQSLQTLSKDKRDVLKPEPKCTLIEFDYKSFEFDLLFQLVNKPFDEQSDPHVNVMNYLFDNDLSEIEGYDYRSIGKTINYSFIYGMNLDKVVDIFFQNFFKDMNVKEIDKSLGLIRNGIKEKLEKYELVQVIKNTTDVVMKSYNTDSNLLTNYFGRFIRIEKTHAILNNYIQSTAADFLYFKIRLILNLFEKSKINQSKNKILLQNHDSILIQLEDHILTNSTVFEEINAIMEASLNNLKGRVKFYYGKNWKKLV